MKLTSHLQLLPRLKMRLDGLLPVTMLSECDFTNRLQQEVTDQTGRREIKGHYEGIQEELNSFKSLFLSNYHMNHPSGIRQGSRVCTTSSTQS
jgi:hypothetical protein